MGRTGFIRDQLDIRILVLYLMSRVAAPVDFVTLAVPNELHKPLAIEAMSRGKHVVSEKPVTLCSRTGGMIVSPDEVLESIRNAEKGVF